MVARGVGARVALCVALVAAAACGDDPEDVVGTASSTTSTAPPAPPAAAPAAVPSVPAQPGQPGTAGTEGAADPLAEPDPGGAAPALPTGRIDTGYTRLRVTIANEADWATAQLVGATIRLVRVTGTSGAAQVTSLGPVLSVAGRGTATIDIVAAIAPGQVVTLVTCKNYLGPATTTVTRRTDGDVVVASVSSVGTDPAVPAGRCENHQATEVGRADLIGPIRWPARVDPRPLVLAQYYPWYGPQDLAQDFGDQPVGPADTSDPAAVRSAMDLAAASGIDGFVVEYEATAALEPRIDALYRVAEQRGGFQLAMQLDLDILAYRHGSISEQVLDGALRAILARAGSPQQLRVGNQPVLFVYGSDHVSDNQWRQAIDRLGAAAAPYVVADGPFLGAPGRYAYATNTQTNTSLLVQWSNSALDEMRLMPGLDGRPAALWVAPMSPGYDDRRLHRPTPVFVDRAAGQRYLESWWAAAGTLPDWIVVTSWNEYHEQTHVAPGHLSGELALQQTAEFAAAFHTNG